MVKRIPTVVASLVILAGLVAFAPLTVAADYTIHRDARPDLVRASVAMGTVNVAPYDEANGLLNDGQDYYYIVKDGAGVELALSVHKHWPSGTVRLGFDDGDPGSALVDTGLSRVSLLPSTIPADGATTATRRSPRPTRTASPSAPVSTSRSIRRRCYRGSPSRR